MEAVSPEAVGILETDWIDWVRYGFPTAFMCQTKENVVPYPSDDADQTSATYKIGREATLMDLFGGACYNTVKRESRFFLWFNPEHPYFLRCVKCGKIYTAPEEISFLQPEKSHAANPRRGRDSHRYNARG